MKFTSRASQHAGLQWAWNSFRNFFLSRFGIFFLDFLAGTICLVFATVWNLNLSFCMVFATFWHVHLPFCMGFTTCGHVHLPFCMVFATFWHVHLPFCMGFPTCVHVHLPFCMVFATFCATSNMASDSPPKDRPAQRLHTLPVTFEEDSLIPCGPAAFSQPEEEQNVSVSNFMLDIPRRIDVPYWHIAT